jgi:TPR repeat protein
LANVNESLHLVVLGCQPDRLPSGSITLRSIEIRRAMPSVNPTEAEVERAVLSGDWVAARAVLERAAAAGQAGAAFHLGNALKFGFGGPVDFSRALAYYAAAADVEPEAAIEQADLLAKGLGVKQDYPAAMRLLSQERVRSIPRAQYLLGLLHWRGRGTPVDLAGARDLLESAAAHGQVEAMVSAGVVCLELGDVDQAYRWLSLVKARHADSIGPMMQFVNHRIEALSLGMLGSKRSALDSDVAAWPARQFSAAKRPG